MLIIIIIIIITQKSSDMFDLQELLLSFVWILYNSNGERFVDVNEIIVWENQKTCCWNLKCTA